MIYHFKLKHDKGITKIKVYASSLLSAKKALAKSEGCPLSAIVYQSAKKANKKK